MEKLSSRQRVVLFKVIGREWNRITRRGLPKGKGEGRTLRATTKDAAGELLRLGTLMLADSMHPEDVQQLKRYGTKTGRRFLRAVKDLGAKP